MTDYKTFVAYLKIKSIVTPGKLHPRICPLFEKEEDLAKMVFNELTEGCFKKDSKAGEKFCEHCRKYVYSNSTTYKLIYRLQQNFLHIKEDLTDIFKKRPTLHDVAFPCITD
jgi:hypothetical protein